MLQNQRQQYMCQSQLIHLYNMYHYLEEWCLQSKRGVDPFSYSAPCLKNRLSLPTAVIGHGGRLTSLLRLRDSWSWLILDHFQLLQGSRSIVHDGTDCKNVKRSEELVPSSHVFANNTFMKERRALVWSIWYCTLLRKLRHQSTHSPKYWRTWTHSRFSPWICSWIFLDVQPQYHDLRRLQKSSVLSCSTPQPGDPGSTEPTQIPPSMEMSARSSALEIILHPAGSCTVRTLAMRTLKRAGLRTSPYGVPFAAQTSLMSNPPQPELWYTLHNLRGPSARWISTTRYTPHGMGLSILENDDQIPGLCCARWYKGMIPWKVDRFSHDSLLDHNNINVRWS